MISSDSQEKQDKPRNAIALSIGAQPMSPLFLLFSLLLFFAPALEAQRPQDPQRPFPYQEQRLFFDNPHAEGVRLAGTLTVPHGDGPFPAVVLVSGSGPQDRDEALAGHRPFLVLADYLTQRGIAVLRYDDRGAFQSTGDFIAATTQDLASDAQAAVEYLGTRDEIDPAKIGIVGHSEGGLIAPMVAVQSPAVAFIVLLAGTGIPGEQLMYLQQALILASQGGDATGIAFIRTRTELFFAVLKQGLDADVAEQRLRQIWNDYLDGKIVPPDLSAAETEPILAELATLSVEDKVELTRTTLDPQLKELNRPWWTFFLSYDPATALTQVRVPVLALNGDKDLQVPARENLDAIAAALRQGGNPDFSIVELPNLNHFFQTSTTGAPSEYAVIEETFAPVALDILGDWIVSRTITATAVVESRIDGQPVDFGLAQNHPNPFNGQTLIPFTLAQAGPVELSVYNGLGQKVANLVQGERAAGAYTLHWDGRDASGLPLASGIYYYRLSALGWTQTRQLLLLR
jgi:uncharacterized protein